MKNYPSADFEMVGKHSETHSDIPNCKYTLCNFWLFCNTNVSFFVLFYIDLQLKLSFPLKLNTFAKHCTWKYEVDQPYFVTNTSINAYLFANSGN